MTQNGNTEGAYGPDVAYVLLCSRCNEERPANYFREADNDRGFAATCRPCENQRNTPHVRKHRSSRYADPSYRAHQAATKRAWQRANKAKRVAAEAKRSAAKKHRTPKWADLDAILAFYENCPEGYHVDHIIPLQGDVVSGLHTLENLQYLPAKENLAKGNRLQES
jgi:hypothetical protein